MEISVSCNTLQWNTGQVPLKVQDAVIQKARVQSGDDAFHVSAAPKDTTAAQLAQMDLGMEEQEGDEDAEAQEAMRSVEQTVKAVASTSGADIPTAADKELHSFEIDPGQVTACLVHEV